MNFSKETQDKVMELQTLEQNMHNLLSQKQQIQISLNEIDNALNELKKVKDKEAYKIIGDVMIKNNVKDLEKDLNDKKSILELRSKNIEKQEEKIKEKFSSLQKEVMKKLENEGSK